MKKSTGKFSKNTKENTKIPAEHFEHNVFNRTVDWAFDPSIVDEVSKLLTKEHISTSPPSKDIQTMISEMANKKVWSTMVFCLKHTNFGSMEM